MQQIWQYFWQCFLQKVFVLHFFLSGAAIPVVGLGLPTSEPHLSVFAHFAALLREGQTSCLIIRVAQQAEEL